MISRRGFFGLVAAAVVAPSLPKPAPGAWVTRELLEDAPILFHPDAFALTMQPLSVEEVRRLHCTVTNDMDYVYSGVGDTITVPVPARFRTLR